MDAKKLQQERVQLFRDAANFKKTDRIPYFSSAVTWKVFDAGHTLDDAMTSFSTMEECARHFLDTYPVDAILDIGIRNQFNVTEAFGSEGYYYYTPDVVGIHDHAHCTLETLEEYQNDPLKYTWEKILPNKYGEDWEKKDISKVHLSIDIDGMDPVIVHATGTRVENGLGNGDFYTFIDKVFETRKVISTDFVEYNPTLEDDNTTTLKWCMEALHYLSIKINEL